MIKEQSDYFLMSIQTAYKQGSKLWHNKSLADAESSKVSARNVTLLFCSAINIVNGQINLKQTALQLTETGEGRFKRYSTSS